MNNYRYFGNNFSKLFCALILLTLSGAKICAQKSVTIDTLAKRLELQTILYPQEKIHVTTDRSDYFGGDTLWLRAFVVDASTHKPVNASKYVYVDLKNPYDSIVSRIKIMERNGIYKGYIAMPLHMEEGSYTLSAYTLFMDNLGKEYFFQKNINIRSPYSVNATMQPDFHWNNDGSLNMEVNLIDTSSPDQRKKYYKMTYTTPDLMERERSGGDKAVKFKLNKKDLSRGYVLVNFDNYGKYIKLPSRPDEEYWVSFMPEGGYLVPDYPCRVAYKAIANNGRSTKVTGVITASDGQIVGNISTGHGGIGVAEFIPTLNERYKAVVKDSNGHEMTFSLPGVNKDAAVLRINSQGDSLIIQAQGNVPAESLVIIQQRGHMLAAESAGQQNRIAKSDLPAGIVQVLLLDKTCNTLSERLVFIKDTGEEKAEITIADK